MTENHDKHYMDPVTGTHTNTIEGIYHGFKATYLNLVHLFFNLIPKLA